MVKCRINRVSLALIHIVLFGIIAPYAASFILCYCSYAHNGASFITSLIAGFTMGAVGAFIFSPLSILYAFLNFITFYAFVYGKPSSYRRKCLGLGSAWGLVIAVSAYRFFGGFSFPNDFPAVIIVGAFLGATSGILMAPLWKPILSMDALALAESDNA